ncbi:D-isomer specific 2-hydroxyacid dehydrogenase family protein [Clostridium uliginosum]|uniref:D-lactate dehydrogenase n=1 Tax=Clostridium uliginosum TaxID=119641 RepID=A0A1I1N1D2_9CLOT|nr:D-isomer specific 2-hydroxyacid dehydrogenase family protein [Clostridium uliginosum]SFC88653.1 D-lactate dehydrogenase [Clostridium uliginosum]
MKIVAYCVRLDEMSSFEKFSKKYDHDVKIVKESFSPATANLAEGYDAVCILGNCTANREAIEMISKLGVKYLATRSAGFNNIDLEAAKEVGIEVSNVPAYSPNAVGEFAVAVTLCLARNFKQAFKRVELQDFSLGGLIGFELRNKTIGFIGTGRVGQTAIKAFSGFGCKMIGYDLYPNDNVAKYLEYKTLAEVLAEADIISLHCPLTEDNLHLINEETIAKMKDGAILINTSRGQLVDSRALIEGLKSGKIGGAAIDVYENEYGIFHYNHENDIIKDENLLTLKSLPNVIVTSHYAFYTDEAVTNMVEYSLQNLYEFEKTNTCKNKLV